MKKIKGFIKKPIVQYSVIITIILTVTVLGIVEIVNEDTSQHLNKEERLQKEIEQLEIPK